MLEFPDEYFDDEVRDGFYVSGVMKRMWAAEMETLNAIAEICERHDLRWNVAYGTMLGAIRHKGYIPWDDDMDIWMPREDFDQFYLYFKDEAPDGFLLADMRNIEKNEQNVISCVGNSEQRINFEPEFLRLFHDFPYRAVVDIFPLDYVARDQDDEDWRQAAAKTVVDLMNRIETLDDNGTRIAEISLKEIKLNELEANKDNISAKELLTLMADVTEVAGYHFDNNNTIYSQIYLVFEGLCGYFHEDESDDIAQLILYWKHHFQRYPKEYFDKENLIWVPFENIRVRVPKEYQKILADCYGPNYMVPYKSWGFHAYPFFIHNEEKKVESILSEEGKKSPFHYKFDARDIENAKSSFYKDSVKEFLSVLKKTDQYLQQSLQSENAKEIAGSFALMQQIAIQIGNIIELARPERKDLIRSLEEFCEEIYQVNEMLFGDEPADETNITELFIELESNILQLSASLQNEYLDRREIVFYVDRASRWEAVRGLWEVCCQDPMNDVYVIAVPYQRKRADAVALPEMILEADRFPKNVQLTDCLAYNYKLRQPDIIFIQNAYDAFNYTSTINPTFYSTELYPHTRKLIYVPWFVLDDVNNQDPVSKLDRMFYVKIPGVVRADLTIVQSERMAESYREALVELSGEDYSAVWNQKIKGFGSLLDKLGDEQSAVAKKIWNEIVARCEG